MSGALEAPGEVPVCPGGGQHVWNDLGCCGTCGISQKRAARVARRLASNGHHTCRFRLGIGDAIEVCVYCGAVGRRDRVVTTPRRRGGWTRLSSGRKVAITGQLIERDGNWCRYCRIPFAEDQRFDRSAMRRTIDHVVPRAEGGSAHISNLVLACAWCNERKSDRSVQVLFSMPEFHARVRWARKQRGIHPDGDGWWHADMGRITDEDGAWWFSCSACGGVWWDYIEAKAARCEETSP